MESSIRTTAAHSFSILASLTVVLFLCCDLYGQEHDTIQLSREHSNITELLDNLSDKTDRNYTALQQGSHEADVRSSALADMQELLNNDLVDLANRLTECAALLEQAIGTLDFLEERLQQFEEQLNDVERNTISAILSTRWVCPYFASSGTPNREINRQSLARIAIYNPNDSEALVTIEWHIYNGELYTESVSIPPWSMEYTDEWTSNAKGPLSGHIIISASIPVQPAGYNSMVRGPLQIMQRRIKGENTYSLTWYPVIDVRY